MSVVALISHPTDVTVCADSCWQGIYLFSYTLQALQIPGLKQIFFFLFDKYHSWSQKSSEYVS